MVTPTGFEPMLQP